MKHILIGDTHYDCNAGSEEVFNQQIKLFKEQIFPYMKENNINSIIQSGDITDNRTKISLNIQHRLKEELFDVIEKENFNLIAILGNHDIFYKTNLNVYSMEIFEKAYKDNFTVIKKPTKLNNLLLVPWLCSKEDEEYMFKKVKEINPKGVIGHFEISNFYVSKTYKAEHGISSKDFKDIKVFSGHYHLKQEEGNIFYIGTPYQTSWTDYSEQKGFYILDDETLEISFIENISSAKHLKVYLNSEEKTCTVTDGITEDFYKVSKLDYNIFTNSKVKIYIDKDNAFNKKVIENILEKVLSYRIEVLDKPDEDLDETKLDENLKYFDYDIKEAISTNLENNYQKEVFEKVVNKSLLDMKE